MLQYYYCYKTLTKVIQMASYSMNFIAIIINKKYQQDYDLKDVLVTVRTMQTKIAIEALN